MKQFTVRHDDPVLEKRFKQKAKLANQSVNQRIVRLMRSDVGMSGVLDSAQKEPSWKKFAGTFSEDAFDDQVFEDFEKVDPSMWA